MEHMYHIQDKRRTKFVDQKPDKTNQPTREGVARKGPPFFYDHRTWSNAMAYQLDEKDKSILKILQENGDFTTRDIAKKTLLPITTVHNPLNKLKRNKKKKKKRHSREISAPAAPGRCRKSFFGFFFFFVTGFWGGFLGGEAFF